LSDKTHLKTKRLQLRRPTDEDASCLSLLWKDEDVRQFLGGTISDAMITERLATIQDHWEQHGFGLCVVSEIETEQVIGLCGLHHSEDGVEISFMFFPEWWGEGFATEAITACLDDGFHHLKLEKIISITQAANIKSCRLLERIGMQPIKTFLRYNATQCWYELKK